MGRVPHLAFTPSAQMIPYAHHLKTRVGVFRDGVWLGKSTAVSDWEDGGADKVQWGQAGDVPVPHDYLGEGSLQLAVFRPDEGNWYLKSALGRENFVVQCGKKGDLPVPADYFGEGKPRIAVYRPSNGAFYIKDWESSTGNLVIRVGEPGDLPIPYDYFGEGKPRLAVFRPANGMWYIKGANVLPYDQSSGNVEIQCGEAGDIPVPANYFNEKRPRLAVFRPSTGTWLLKGIGSANWDACADNVTIQCGAEGDVPAPGDYYGEGVTRIAVWRPTDGSWCVKGFGPADWDASTGPVPLFQNQTHALGQKGDVLVARDYGGQGHLRMAIFRHGMWLIAGKPNVIMHFGQKGDVPVQGDFENCPGESFAVFRPSEGKWYIKGEGDDDWETSKDNWVLAFGRQGDIPVPRDYFGDGNDRLAVFSPTEGVWRIKASGSDDWDEQTGVTIDMNGQPGDVPVPHHYLAQLHPNLALFRSGTWLIKAVGVEGFNDSKGSVIVQHGQEGDVPVPFDYFDEGVPRLAVFRPATGQWLIKGRGNVDDWDKSVGNLTVQCGQAGDVALPFDYFDEGRPRLAVFRPATGEWLIKGPGLDDWEASTGNKVFRCGQAGDVPFRHLPFRRRY